MNDIKLIENLKKHGVEYVVDKFSLKHKSFGHKFSLKYDQLNTPKNESTNYCRGIVLDNDFNIISLPFIRFSNYDNNSRKIIDWNSAKYFEKTDGTMIQFYYDKKTNEWCVGTTGSGEATDNLSCIDKISNEVTRSEFNFSDLTFKLLIENKTDYTKFNKNYTYIFELTSEFNIVVNHYQENKLTLLGIRDLTNLKELDQTTLDSIANEFNLNRPKEYFFENEEAMLKSLRNVKFGDLNFEGYVIVDDQFNRLKVKSNKYIIYSQFNGDISSKYRLIDIILNKETEEVLSTFPELTDTINTLKSKLEKILNPVEEAFNYLKNSDDIEKKEFFITGQKSINFNKKLKCVLVVFTELLKNKDLEFTDALFKINMKSLYKAIK